jgi:competence protein ComEA
MRSRRTANDEAAEVARRRLELLGAELAGLRRDGQDAGPDASERADRRADGIRASEESAALSAAAPGRHARRSVGVAGSIAGWLHDRLPPTLQGRVQLGASHLTVVALIVAAALGATAWWVLRAGGSGTPLPPTTAAVVAPSPSALVSLSATATTSPEAARASSPAPGATIVIDVTGKVRSPGIATLPGGSRVVDALKAAGGARRGANLTSLNLARPLVDGEQIVVGVPSPPGVAPSAASAPEGSSSAAPLVNINTADQTALETLPGVGPVTAQAILKWRTDNGSFTAVDDLLEVSGIGDATLAEIAPFVTL